jgi:hypothetical protein
MKKELSIAQKEYLEKKITAYVIAKDNMNFFIEFLYKELEIDNTWKLNQDLTAFEKEG